LHSKLRRANKIIYPDTRFALSRIRHQAKDKIAKESFEEYIFPKLETVLMK